MNQDFPPCISSGEVARTVIGCYVTICTSRIVKHDCLQSPSAVTRSSGSRQNFIFSAHLTLLLPSNKGECDGLDMRHVQVRRQTYAGSFKTPLHNDFRECFKFWISRAGWCIAMDRIYFEGKKM